MLPFLPVGGENRNENSSSRCLNLARLTIQWAHCPFVSLVSQGTTKTVGLTSSDTHADYTFIRILMLSELVCKLNFPRAAKLIQNLVWISSHQTNWVFWPCGCFQRRGLKHLWIVEVHLAPAHNSPAGQLWRNCQVHTVVFLSIILGRICKKPVGDIAYYEINQLSRLLETCCFY